MAQLKIPEVLTSEEQTLLLKQPNKRYPTQHRNYLMMKLMLDLGLRVSEVIALEVRDVNWQSGQVKVRQGKGRKDRILWLNEKTLEELSTWRVKQELAHQALLFGTSKGTKVADHTMRRAVKRYGNLAGIEKDVHPHMLRHTFATDLYRQSRNIRLVQKALGHANLQTTMIYTHIVDDELEEAMKQFR